MVDHPAMLRVVGLGGRNVRHVVHPAVPLRGDLTAVVVEVDAVAVHHPAVLPVHVLIVLVVPVAVLVRSHQGAHLQGVDSEGEEGWNIRLNEKRNNNNKGLPIERLQRADDAAVELDDRPQATQLVQAEQLLDRHGGDPEERGGDKRRRILLQNLKIEITFTAFVLICFDSPSAEQRLSHGAIVR